MPNTKSNDIIALIKEENFTKAKNSIKSVKSGDPGVSELLYWVILNYAEFNPGNVVDLLEAGADINYHEGEKDTLYTAALNEAPFFVWLLSKHSDKINVERFNGSHNDLFVASFKNKTISESTFIDILEKLDAMGMVLTNKDEEGNNLLHLSVNRGFLNLYLLLWLKGLDPEDVNNKGEKTYSILEKYPRMKKVVDIIKSLGKPEEITKDKFAESCTKFKQSSITTPANCSGSVTEGGFFPGGLTIKEINVFYQNYKTLVPSAAIPIDTSDESYTYSSYTDSYSYTVDSYSKSSVVIKTNPNNSGDPPKVEKSISPVATAGTLLINNESDIAFATGASPAPGSGSCGQGNGMDDNIGIADRENHMEGFGNGFGNTNINNNNNNNNNVNNMGVPLNDNCCSCCPGGLRDQCLRMYDLSEGPKVFCKNSILGFVIMAVFWILVIAFIFIGINDF